MRILPTHPLQKKGPQPSLRPLSLAERGLRCACSLKGGGNKLKGRAPRSLFLGPCLPMHASDAGPKKGPQPSLRPLSLAERGSRCACSLRGGNKLKGRAPRSLFLGPCLPMHASDAGPKKRAATFVAALKLGGEGGIRTPGTLLGYTRFPGVHLQPLGHLSKKNSLGNIPQSGTRKYKKRRRPDYSEYSPDRFLCIIR